MKTNVTPGVVYKLGRIEGIARSIRIRLSVDDVDDKVIRGQLDEVTSIAQTCATTLIENMPKGDNHHDKEEHKSKPAQ